MLNDSSAYTGETDAAPIQCISLRPAALMADGGEAISVPAPALEGVHLNSPTQL